MLSRQDSSRRLMETLNEFGYSEKRIQERTWVIDRDSLAKTLSTREIVNDVDVEKFFVGSKREGISLAGESDTDCMQVNTSVVCTDKLRNIKTKRTGQVIFRLDRRRAPAGYTYLRYNRQDRNSHKYFSQLQHALGESSKGVYLSSAKFMSVNEDVFYGSSGYIGKNTVYKERRGPSIPKIVKDSWIRETLLKTYGACSDIDFVRGFRCFCPSVLNNWLHRRRFHNWPTEETKKVIERLPYHVVPVGQTGSPFEHLQWRISFTIAEVFLVRLFNETQRKMLILLKLIARHILKPIDEDINSYIMKNVAFWMAENIPIHKFTEDQLVDRVMDAIEFLIGCVRRKKLHNYMQSDRNILHGKFQGTQRNILLAKLQEIKYNGEKECLCNILLSSNVEKDYPLVHDALVNANFMNYYDKCNTLALFPISPVQLARYFTFCFYCNFGLTIQIYTHLLNFKHCVPLFGLRWLSDPMSIDLTEKANETKTYFYKSYIIARNKAKTQLLLRLEPCSWLFTQACQIFGRHADSVVVFLKDLYVLLLFVTIRYFQLL